MSKNVKFIVFCVFAIIFYLFVKFLSNDIFFGDDTSALTSWLYGGGKYNLDSVFTAFMPKFFGKYLPLFFNIHPHEFSMSWGAYIRAFDTAILCLVMSLFMFNGRKKTKTFPLVMLFSAFYFCYASANMNFDWINPNLLPAYDLTGSFVMLTEYSQHFGQLLTFILGIFALYYITENFTQNKVPDKKSVFVISFLAFLTAISSMFVNIIVGIVLIFCSIYLLIVYWKNLKSKISQYGKTILIPLICYLAGSLIFAIYPGYLNFLSINTDFVSFLKSVCKSVIFANSLEFALILALSAILYFLALNKSTFIKRTIFIVFSTILGVFIYMLMFSSLGDSVGEILTESIVLIRLVFISLIFLLFGACLREHTSEPKEQRIVSVAFSVILIAFTIVQMPLVYTTMKLWTVMSNETKITVYSIEKMYRFYSLKGKTALLPEDSLLKIFKISNFLDDENIDKNQQISGNIFFKNTTFTNNYYKNFYNNPNIVAYKFIDSKKALKIFYEEGGIITGNEIQKIKFQNLYDDKFVLYRAIEKSKYDIQ